jgi:hypothetical protein
MPSKKKNSKRRLFGLSLPALGAKITPAERNSKKLTESELYDSLDDNELTTGKGNKLFLTNDVDMSDQNKSFDEDQVDQNGIQTENEEGYWPHEPGTRPGSGGQPLRILDDENERSVILEYLHTEVDPRTDIEETFEQVERSTMALEIITAAFKAWMRQKLKNDPQEIILDEIERISYNLDDENLTTLINMLLAAQSGAKLERQSYSSEDITHISLIAKAGDERVSKPLTPIYIKDILIPYLQAIAELQAVINELKGDQFNEIHIIEIKISTLVEVSMIATHDAVNILKETIIPWCRDHAEEMATLERTDKLIEDQRTLAGVLTQKAQNSEGPVADTLYAEVEQVNEHINRLREEFDNKRVAFEEAKAHMTLDVLLNIKPHIRGAKRIAFLTRLAPHLDKLTSSELELVTG